MGELALKQGVLEERLSAIRNSIGTIIRAMECEVCNRLKAAHLEAVHEWMRVRGADGRNERAPEAHTAWVRALAAEAALAQHLQHQHGSAFSGTAFAEQGNTHIYGPDQAK